MRAMAAFLRAHRDRIVTAWLARSASLPSASDLPAAALRDHVPQIVDAMADAIDRDDATSVSLDQLPLIHANERLAEGYDLRQVVAEYRNLRRAIFDEFAANPGGMSPESLTRLPPLAVLNENIDHAIADAVDHYSLQRNRTRDYFAGILGHDLRSPLHVISMNAQLLLRREETLPAAELKMVARIAANAVHMERLIADLLDFARTRLGGGLPVTRIECDLHAIVAESVDGLASAHPDRTIALRKVPPHSNLVGEWDGARLAQAVANLVSNALKHGTDPIDIELRDEGSHVTLAVGNGGEIEAESRVRLFEPFHTGDTERGTGLGLYIVREIARAHSGSVELATDTPGHTVFRLRLPRH